MAYLPDLTREVLDTLKAETLTKVSRKLGLRGIPTRKAEIIVELARYFKTHLREYVDQLSPLERSLLAEAAYHDCQVEPATFSAKYGASCPLLDRYGSLDDTSLLRPVFIYDAGRLMIPQRLAERLKGVLEEPRAVQANTVEEIPRVLKVQTPSWRRSSPDRAVHLHHGETGVFQELRRVLTQVQMGKLKITDKGRRPTGAAVNKLAGALVQPDFAVGPPEELRDEHAKEAGPIRAHAWGVLVQQCKWARPKSGVLTLTQAGKEMLTISEPEVFRRGVDEFWESDDFDELNRIDHIRGQSGKGKRGLTRPDERKSCFVESMRQWPVNRWLSFSECYRLISAHGYHFDVSKAPYYLYFAESHYGGLGDAEEGLNRQYLRALLFESLATLGIVDVAYTHPHDLWPELGDRWGIDELHYCSRYDGLLYVRLNSLGAYCLELIDQYEAEGTGKRELFAVLPNLELAIMSGKELPPADECVLESFAGRRSDHVWKIDAERVMNLLDAGGSVRDIEAFLQANATGGLPENVLRFLRDIEKKTAAVKSMEDAVLIEVGEEATAALIAHDSQAGKICYPAGPNRLAVPQKNLRAFRGAMKKLGYILPR